MTEFRPIEDMDKSTRRLVKFALRVRRKAYAPYSKFLVGVAVQDNQGKIHTGCNVENVSYSVSLCAERVAIAKMVTRGARECRKLVVLTTHEEPVFPCGNCLQFIHEFGKKTQVFAVNRRATVFREATLSELLPYGFVRGHLQQ